MEGEENFKKWLETQREMTPLEASKHIGMDEGDFETAKTIFMHADCSYFEDTGEDGIYRVCIYDDTWTGTKDEIERKLWTEHAIYGYTDLLKQEMYKGYYR